MSDEMTTEPAGTDPSAVVDERMSSKNSSTLSDDDDRESTLEVELDVDELLSEEDEIRSNDGAAGDDIAS